MLFLGTWPLWGQAQGPYEEQIKQLTQYYVDSACVSSNILANWLLEHPQKLKEGTDFHATQVYFFDLTENHDLEKLSTEQLLSRLIPHCTEVPRRGLSFAKRKKIIDGFPIGWFEGDSVLYQCDLNGTAVFQMAKYQSFTYHAFEMLKSKGIQMVFKLYEVDLRLIFGLSEHQLWVARLVKSPSNPAETPIIELYEWEAFRRCCSKDF